MEICVTNNKTFWRSVKPLFSDKENITLVYKNDICEQDNKISVIFNDFFINAVINLNIEVNRDCLNDNVNALDLIIKASKTYENHQSVLKIRETRGEIFF